MRFTHTDVINDFVGLIGYCALTKRDSVENDFAACEKCIFQPSPGSACPVRLLEDNYRLSDLFRRARILDDQAVENERRIFK